MYRNDLYSNTSESSRKKSGSWVYINGELYHAGVKGMKWGQHLPGTDWWKKISGEFRRGVTTYENQQRNVNRATTYKSGPLSWYGTRVQSGKNPSNIQGYADHAPAFNKEHVESQFRKPNSIGYKAKMYGTVAGQMAKRRLTKAGNAVVSTAKSVASKVTSSTHVKDLASKAAAGASKAKSVVSKYAGQAVSSLKSTASKYKSKVSSFLNKFKTSSTENRKELSSRRRPESKAEQAGKKVDRENQANRVSKRDSSSYTKKLIPNTVTPAKRTVTISSQKSPYYKG